MRIGLSMLCILAVFTISAQSGGRKNERSMHGKSNFGARVKSKGHADEFANGNRNKGYFWRHLFGTQKPAWENRISGSNSVNFKYNRTLFSFKRPQGHHDNDELLNENRKKRMRWIEQHRGNTSFSEKKYN